MQSQSTTKRTPSRAQTYLGLACLILIIACTTGCISFAANLMGVIRGNTRPAEYEGLEGKRVALICVSESGLEVDKVSSMLTSYMQANINSHIDEIDLVRQSEIERWLERHASEAEEFVEVGKGVKAEKLIAVEVENLTLKDGATLYKGQCDISVSVFDVPSGKIEFRKQLPEFAYPTIGGPSITDTTDAKFRGLFLSVLADKISGLFYDVEVGEDFALDAKSNSF